MQMDPAAVETTAAGELRRLLRLAWPVVIGQLGVMGMGVVDVAMVGRLGETALAGVALGNTWAFGVTVVALGALGGMDPVISQAFGAGRRDDAGRGLVRGLALGALLAIPVIALCALAGSGLQLLSQPAEVIPISAEYAGIVGVSALPWLIFEAIRRFLQGAGIMKPAAVAIVICNVINAAANWAFIHGLGPLPEMGVIGVAWSTLLTRTAMMAILLWLGRDLVRECWPREGPLASLPGTWGLFVIGFPLGLQMAAEVWAFGGTSVLMGWLGPREIAAHSLALNLSAIAFMIPFGISTAAATRAGNLLGAGERWQRAGWVAVALGAGVMTVSAALFTAIPEQLVGLYTHEAGVIALAATLLPMAALFQIFDGTQAVAFGVLRGVGDTRWPPLINLVGYWLLGIPFGYWLAFHQGRGAIGIWTGLVVGLAVVGVLVVARLWWTGRRGGYAVG